METFVSIHSTGHRRSLSLAFIFPTFDFCTRPLMRWFPFVILAYLFVAVQFSLGGALGWGEVTPNLILLFLLFIGLHAPTDAALVAGFTLGLLHDIIASHGIGTYTLAYPLIAVMTVQLRGAMYADHAVTHVAVTLLQGTALTIYLWVRQWIRALYFTEEPTISFKSRMLGVLVTGALAMPAIWALRKVRRSFAFEKNG